MQDYPFRNASFSLFFWRIFLFLRSFAIEKIKKCEIHGFQRVSRRRFAFFRSFSISLPEFFHRYVLKIIGNDFLRGFADYMLDIANEKAGLEAGIVLVKPQPSGALEAFHAQDCLYTVLLRGMEAGKAAEQARLITAVQDAVSPYTEYKKYAAYARLDTLRFILSNTTEAGITLDESDEFSLCPPRTYPGKLCKFLFERAEAFDYAPDKGLIILPTELIDDNGGQLRRCVKALARAWGLGAKFGRWLDEACTFASTLVDRIVTGYPREEAERREIWARLGYEDRLLVTGEPFALWVIEANRDLSAQLPLPACGLPVIFTDDCKPYKQRKVRILNGAHTSMVLGAYLAGHEIVGDCMADDTMRSYMSQALFNEIMPTLDLPKDDLEAFASAIFERFSNPFNRHLLLSIALNSQSKFRARVLPTIKEYVKRTGSLPKILTFSMAAFIAFYCGKKKEDGSFVGVRAAGNEYPIADDQFVLDFFAAQTGKSAAEIAHAVLTNVDFWGSDLTAELPGFEASVAKSLDAIFTKGAAKAIEEVVAKE